MRKVFAASSHSPCSHSPDAKANSRSRQTSVPSIRQQMLSTKRTAPQRLRTRCKRHRRAALGNKPSPQQQASIDQRQREAEARKNSPHCKELDPSVAI